jgi:hypothetical protein
MGTSRWDSNDYSSYESRTKIKSLSREQVFTSRNINKLLDPRNIALRESCDSVYNPNSTPIIFGLDVTGSMGFIAESIAKEGLASLMTEIHESLPVSDPHIMFMAVGDIRSDQGPLQVSQFEADLNVIEQLRMIWLEGGGGGNNTESYDLPWYFAANRTAIDSYNKRNKKGYLFTFGDELPPNEPLPLSGLQRLFGGQVQESGSTAELLEQAREKYKVFHIIAEEGSYCRTRLQNVRSQWTELLGNNAIFMRDHKDLVNIVIATLRIAEGADIDTVIAESQNKAALTYAFSNSLQG